MRLAGSAQDLIRAVEAPQLKARLPRFGPGDTVRVTFRIPEGDKERLQLYEGIVIARRGGGTREMVTVRKISFGIGVERQIPLHSPFVAKFEVVTRGKARRAKLYYLRDRTGKASRVKQQFGEAGGMDAASAQETPEMVAASAAEAEARVAADKEKATAKAAEKQAAKAKEKDEKEKAKAAKKEAAKAAKAKEPEAAKA